MEFYFFVRTRVTAPGHLTITHPSGQWRASFRFDQKGVQINTGVPVFDSSFYVYSDTPEFAKSLLVSPYRQQALANLRALCTPYQYEIILKDNILEARIRLEGDLYSLDFSKLNSAMIRNIVEVLKTLVTNIPAIVSSTDKNFAADREITIKTEQKKQYDDFWGLKTWAIIGALVGVTLALFFLNLSRVESVLFFAPTGAFVGWIIDSFFSRKSKKGT